MDYYIPKNLLSTKNAKTIKGEKKGITTYIMYLSPYKQNSLGKNLCSHASKGCSTACLFNSGMGRFNNVQLGKINKSNYFIGNTKLFMKQLYYEILKIVELHMNVVGEKQIGKKGNVIRYKEFTIRLNGSSDIPFENIKIIGGLNIFELFPGIRFYDYTKNDKRFNKKLTFNYHLTFSRSETNDNECISLLKRGFNVAYVFGLNKGQLLPKTYLGYKVIDGDVDDLRFNDEKNVIVGLKYKNITNKGKGFNEIQKETNDFIVKIPELAYTI